MTNTRHQCGHSQTTWFCAREAGGLRPLLLSRYATSTISEGLFCSLWAVQSLCLLCCQACLERRRIRSCRKSSVSTCSQKAYESLRLPLHAYLRRCQVLLSVHDLYSKHMLCNVRIYQTTFKSCTPVMLCCCQNNSNGKHGARLLRVALLA